jgi:hypothetical protein
MRFRLPAGERSSLPFSGTLRRFQILAQPLVLFLEPLILFAQSLVVFFEPLEFLLSVLSLFPGFVSLSSRTSQFPHKFPNTPARIEILEKQIIL